MSILCGWGKMSGGKMSVGCIRNERLRFLHDVLQGRQVVQNVAGFQGMIGVLIKTERRAVGAGCSGDGGSIAQGSAVPKKARAFCGAMQTSGRAACRESGGRGCRGAGRRRRRQRCRCFGKKQYIVVLRPIYGGQLGLGLGVQGVKCLAQGGGAAAQAVLVVGVLQQKGVVVPGAGRQLTAVVEQRLITVVADPGKQTTSFMGKTSLLDDSRRKTP